MSIFSFFGKKTPSVADRDVIAAKIGAYASALSGKREASSNGQTGLSVKLAFEEGKTREAAMQVLDSYEKQGYDVLEERCLFYLVVAGDALWMAEPDNEQRVARDFASLKRGGQGRYERFRESYRGAWQTWWAIEDPRMPGRYAVPKSMPGAPERIFGG